MRLFTIDMDGTCLDSRSRISDKTLAALKHAADAGIMIVPATGRSLSCLPYRLKEQTFFRYVITSNGAQVTDLETGKAVFQALIPKKCALSLLASCKGVKIGITSHIHQEYLLQGKLLAWMGHFVYGKDAGEVYCVKNMAEMIRWSRWDIEELQFYFLSRSARPKIREILKEYPELCAAYTNLYVEIFSKQASKGTALSVLAEYLGIGKDEIACIGDGENDISMFQAAGTTFAVENAVAELKEQADYVLPSNDQNGVAEAIYRYLL